MFFCGGEVSMDTRCDRGDGGSLLFDPGSVGRNQVAEKTFSLSEVVA